MYTKIEEAISNVLKADVQKNALEFVDYLKANGAVFHDSDNYFWHPKYKDVELCTINIEINDDGTTSFDTFWNVLPSVADSWSTEEKEIIWANVRPCEITGCGECSPGINKVILGREFNNLCGSFLGIYAPNAKTVRCMIKLIDGIKNDINNVRT
ncbi:MAG: hypothetical protein FWC89_04960 [Defluviitaleaceae bacterium]|nr:hypothetical protein [Defluviitaleaceae bacterium]